MTAVAKRPPRPPHIDLSGAPHGVHQLRLALHEHDIVSVIRMASGERDSWHSKILDGRYKLGAVLGRGGMGAVYEAEHTWTGRCVAVKLLVPRECDGSHVDEKAADRFLAEARAASKIKHPNVIDVLDMGRDPSTGVVFLVQERLVGESLRVRLTNRERLSLDEAERLLLPAMNGVIAAHDAGVLHRDLKPDNLFIARAHDDTEHIKVIDFGIARLRESMDVSRTRTGVAIGTAGYMSPEQCRGARDLDVRTDVWSMGAVWFEALSGRLPIEGSGYHEVLARTLTEDAPRLRDIVPELSKPVADCIDRALLRDPAVRYADMRVFREALADALRNNRNASPLEKTAHASEPTLIAHESTESRVSAPQGTAVTVATREYDTSRVLGSPWLHRSAVVLVLVLVAAFAFSLRDRTVPPVVASRVAHEDAGARRDAASQTKVGYDATVAPTTAAVVAQPDVVTPPVAMAQAVLRTVTTPRLLRSPRARRVPIIADGGTRNSSPARGANGAPYLEP